MVLSHSMIDLGKVFYYAGQVYRSVSYDRAPLCNDILKRATKWEKYGLVKTREAPLCFKDTL